MSKIVVKRGLLKELSMYIEPNKETIIITDNGIPEKYIDLVESIFDEPLTLLLPQGEDTKSLDVFKHVIEEIASRDFSRNSQIIALGGGVVGDLAGFVAATYLRGIKLIQIPTTLLAQVDSSIGSKVAINHFRKNNVGTFYTPQSVLIDPDCLESLDQRQYNNGMAEVIKYAFIMDQSLLVSIEKNDVETIINRCISLKKKVVEEDLYDLDKRHILNFGHTIGHAIEIDSEFGVLHGEAVAIGMYKEVHPNLKEELKRYLLMYDLPYDYEGDYIDIIRSDKKIKGKVLKKVEVEEIGSCRLMEVDLEEYLKGVE